jgi:ubiquinone/menaquinone biosynthesis C-methylase UbiE
MAAGSKVLHIDGSTSPPESGSYDLILMTRSLESAVDPSALLRHASRLLSDRGRAVVVGRNADSSCFTVFGGRHWSGYQFPGTRQQLTPDSLRRATANAGLRVEHLRTRFASNVWLRSTANWLQDWGAGPAIVSLFTGRWLVPQMVSALLETLAVARGRGSLLVVELKRP